MSDMSAATASTPAKSSDLGQLSFEEALAELERIVRGLEGGQQRLEDAISAYERGSRLRQHCEAKLREAEMRVERIVGTQETGGQESGGRATMGAGQANTAGDLDEEIPF